MTTPRDPANAEADLADMAHRVVGSGQPLTRKALREAGLLSTGAMPRVPGSDEATTLMPRVAADGSPAAPPPGSHAAPSRAEAWPTAPAPPAPAPASPGAPSAYPTRSSQPVAPSAQPPMSRGAASAADSRLAGGQGAGPQAPLPTSAQTAAPTWSDAASGGRPVTSPQEAAGLMARRPVPPSRTRPTSTTRPVEPPLGDSGRPLVPPTRAGLPGPALPAPALPGPALPGPALPAHGGLMPPGPAASGAAMPPVRPTAQAGPPVAGLPPAASAMAPVRPAQASPAPPSPAQPGPIPSSPAARAGLAPQGVTSPATSTALPGQGGGPVPPRGASTGPTPYAGSSYGSRAGGATPSRQRAGDIGGVGATAPAATTPGEAQLTRAVEKVLTGQSSGPTDVLGLGPYGRTSPGPTGRPAVAEGPIPVLPEEPAPVEVKLSRRERRRRASMERGQADEPARRAETIEAGEPHDDVDPDQADQGEPEGRRHKITHWRELIVAGVLLVVLVGVGLTLWLTGIFPGSGEAAPEETAAQTPSVSADVLPSPGEIGATNKIINHPFVNGDLTMTVFALTETTEIGQNAQGRPWAPEKGQFIVIEVEVVNTGTQEHHFIADGQALRTDAGHTYPNDVEASYSLYDNMLGRAALSPDVPQHGYLVFDIASDEKPIALDFTGNAGTTAVVIPLG